MSDRPTADQLRAKIGTITDLSELRALKKDEDRETVLRAIDAREAQLKAEAKEGPPEPRYSRPELIQGARGLGASPAEMAGALASAGMDEATRAEAEAALKAWRTEEVR